MSEDLEGKSQDTDVTEDKHPFPEPLRIVFNRLAMRGAAIRRLERERVERDVKSCEEDE